MAQWMKQFASKLNDFSSIPRTHMVEAEKEVYVRASMHIHVPIHVSHTHTHTHGTNHERKDYTSWLEV